MGNFSNYWDLHTLFTKLKNKLKSISDKIDDSVSLKTATGNPITLTDAANANAEKLLMTIEPIQSGSGDPSPTNVRPISGLTEGKVVACGKNLLDLSSKTTATTLGITFTVNKNDEGAVTSINVNGTSTGVVDFTCPITTLKAGTQYILNGGVAGSTGDYKLQVIYGDNNADAATSTGGDVNFTVLPDVPYRMRIRVYSGKTVNNLTFYPMIRLSTITDPTFEPYTAATATISFGQTVYGGSVNFKTGEVIVTHGMVDLGTLNWDIWSTYGFRTWDLNNVIKATDNSTPINAISSEAIILSWSQYAANTDNTLKFALYKDANAMFIVGGRDMSYADATAFKTAMSGVQLCYELATPTTLTLTPAELELLKGDNTITANGAEISIEYYPDNAIGVLAGRVDDKADKSDVAAALAEKVEIQNNAGFHNSIYRGKFLGTEVTQEQWDAIAAGTFDDMFTGDFWTIGGVNYRIGHFNYWLGTGDTECTLPHVLIVPDTNLYTAKMNDSNITTGAYVGSKMYTTNLAQAKTTINNAFGASHILNHREYLANAMKATADPTYESAGSWYNSTVELMNERMVYGADVFHNVEVNGAIPFNCTIDKSQLALFALDPSRICNRAYWWLRCAVSAADFACVNGSGSATYVSASIALGVRPAFGIKA